MSGLKRAIGKFTSPIFIPLRRFVVWNDQQFGTCDMKLSLEHRWEEKISQKSVETISELQKKISRFILLNVLQVLAVGWHSWIKHFRRLIALHVY